MEFREEIKSSVRFRVLSCHERESKLSIQLGVPIHSLRPLHTFLVYIRPLPDGKLSISTRPEEGVTFTRLSDIADLNSHIIFSSCHILPRSNFALALDESASSRSLAYCCPPAHPSLLCDGVPSSTSRQDQPPYIIPPPAPCIRNQRGSKIIFPSD
jgi:hypothetical protein